MASGQSDPLAAAFNFSSPEQERETNWIAISVVAVVLITTVWWLSTKWVRTAPKSHPEAKTQNPAAVPPAVVFHPEQARELPPPDSNPGAYGAVTTEGMNTWIQLGEWSGSDLLDSKPFVVTGRKWRVSWLYRFIDPNISSFRMYFQRPGQPVSAKEVCGPESNRNQSGQVEIGGGGTFELHAVPIKAEYKVTVEELRS